MKKLTFKNIDPKMEESYRRAVNTLANGGNVSNYVLFEDYFKSCCEDRVHAEMYIDLARRHADQIVGRHQRANARHQRRASEKKVVRNIFGMIRL